MGDQTPTAWEVGASTGINPNAVRKAYRGLEREEVVQARAGGRNPLAGK